MSTYPDAPGHRSVETSIAAANAIAPKLGRLQRLAQTAIRDAGSHGLTADELAARLDMDRWSIQPRTSELRRKGLIFVTAGNAGRMQPTNWPLFGLPHEACRHGKDAIECPA